MEKEPTLENLLNQIKEYSSRKNKYEEMQTRIGTDEGPEVLNPRLIRDLAGRVSRLSTLGRIRKLIAEEVIPEVESNIHAVTSGIEEAVNNTIREQIGEGAQYLTTAELELVKPTELLDLAREYRRGLITIDQYLDEIKQVLGGEPPTESETDSEEIKDWVVSIQKQADNGILTNRSFLERVNREAAALNIEFNLPEVTVSEESPQLIELKPEDIEFSVEEGAVLARLILDRTKKEFSVGGRSFKFALPEDEKIALGSLIASWDASIIENLEEMRNNILTKVEILFRAENADDLVLAVGGDLGEVLIALIILDRAVSPSRMLDFLKSGLDIKKFSEDVYEWMRTVARIAAGEELPKPAPKPVIVIPHPEEPEPEKITVLPDGQSIEDIKGKRENEVLHFLLKSYGAEKLTGLELIKAIWGDVDAIKGKDRLSVAVAELRKQLKNKKWIIPSQKGDKEGYCLVKMIENVEEVVDIATEVSVETPEFTALEVPFEPELSAEPAVTVEVQQIAPHENEKDQEWKKDMEDKVTAIIDKLHLENWSDHMRSHAMTNAFKQSGIGFTVKDKMIEPAIRKEFITKNWTMEIRGISEYSREAAVMLAYLKDHKNWQNMKNDKKYYLIASVERQFKVWEAKNRKGNGH